MIWALYAFLWWLSAFIPLVLMSTSGWRGITWGDLLLLSLVSWIGPVLGLIIVGAVLSEADFWNEPIFGRKKNDHRD